jgi:hypothetical protein
MEADWELEIGGDAPVIEGHWSGFIDLRSHPEKVSEISECQDLPGLTGALLTCNGVDSPVWTSKTDVFLPERVDRHEMNAHENESSAAIACYIDLLPRVRGAWGDTQRAEEFCRRLCACLAARPIRCCRVDVVVRTAIVGEDTELGVTAYVTACGASLPEAKQRLLECLNVVAAVLVAQ